MKTKSFFPISTYTGAHYAFLISLLLFCYRPVHATNNTSLTPGATEGQFEVSLTGGATYSIPILSPPGTGGMKPEITLNYNGGNEKGALGAGWSVQGIPVITRGYKNLERDGVVSGPQYTIDDAIFLNGVRLLPVAKDSMGKWIEYRKEIDDFTRIRGYGSQIDGHSYYRIWTKAGLILEFGNTTSSRIHLKNGKTLLWACNQISDTLRNYIAIEYLTNGTGNYNISKISYTGNKDENLIPYAFIYFDYENLNNPHKSYISGELLVKDKRLKKIRTQFGDQVMREYHLNYINSEIGDNYYLSSIQEFGGDGTAFLPTIFDYSVSNPGWKQLPDFGPKYLPAFGGNSTAVNGSKYIDINDDGRTDYLFSALINGKVVKKTFLSLKNGWKEDIRHNSPVIFATETDQNLSFKFLDINGDMRPDIISDNNENSTDIKGATIYFNTVDGWKKATPEWNIPFQISPLSETPHRFLDINGDGQLDAIYEQDQETTAIISSDKGWQESPEFSTPILLSEAQYASKLNADGNTHDDIVFIKKDGELLNWHIMLSRDDGWEEVEKDSPYWISISVPPKVEAIKIIDINNDGQDDIAISYDDSHNEVRSVLLGSKDGWTLSERELPIPFIINSLAVPFNFADLNGDGRLDILKRTEQPGSGAAFINNESNWEQKDSLIPPQPITVNGKSEYEAFIKDVDGDQQSDIIYQSHSLEYGISRATYLSTGTSWLLAANYAPPYKIAEDGNRNSGVQFVDVNADGLADLVFHLKKKNDTIKGVYFNGPQGWSKTADTKWAPPIPLAEENIGGLGTRFIDINGDGKADLLKGWQTKNGDLDLRAFVNSEAGWKSTPSFNPILPFEKEGLGSLGSRLIDLNGDGLTDLTYSSKNQDGSVTSRTFLNTGDGWKEDSNYNLPIPLTEEYIYLPPEQTEIDVDNDTYEQVKNSCTSRGLGVLFTDLNGDRLPDIAYNHHTHLFQAKKEGLPSPLKKFFWKISNKATSVAGAFINTGKGWKHADAYTPPKRLDGNDNALVAYYESHDVNGDDLVDIIYFEKSKNSGVNNSVTYLNTGSGWFQSGSWKIPNEVFGDAEGDQGIRVMDLNGDNLVDLLFSRVNKKGDFQKKTFLNTGFGWTERKNYAPPYALTESSEHDTGVRIVDVNGDYLADFVVNRKRADGTTIKEVSLNTAGRVGLLSSITNGLGFKINITHRVLTNYRAADGSPLNQDFYQPDKVSQYPQITAPPPAIAIDRVTLEEKGIAAQSFRYRYGGFRVNSLSGAPLGFRWREVLNLTSGMVEHSELSQERHKVGRLVRHYTGFPDKKDSSSFTKPYLSLTENNWTITQSNSLLFRTPKTPIQVNQVQLASGKTTSYDLNGAQLSWQSENFSYDKFGNVTHTKILRSDGTYTNSENEYKEDDRDKWYLGRLTHSKVTVGNSKGEKQVKESAFHYHSATGLLHEEIANLHHPKAVTVRYLHDSFGNVTSTTSSAHGATPRTITTEYDDLGRFEITERNALAHTSTGRLDPLFGNPIMATDPNGLTTTFTYDSLGRPESATSATGVVSKTWYSFPEDSDPQGVAYTIQTQIGDMPQEATFFDCKHRPLMTITEGFGGKKVFKQTKYDDLGREIGVTAPYYGDNSPLWTWTSYDRIDRPEKVNYPDGRTLHFEYKGYSTTVTDQDNRKTITEYNLHKLPVCVTEPESQPITYFYGVSGRVTRITNVDGSVITHEYDELGNRIKTSDPDLGVWEYKYDAYGQLTWQKDAKDVETTIEYDVLGRPLQRTAQGNIVKWGYDSADRGIGMQAFVKGSDNYREEYLYDEFSRLSTSNIYIDGQQFTFQTTFDQYGRTVGVTYPTGFSISQQFDPQGFVSQVIETSTNRLFWKAILYNEHGQLEESRLGNGLSTVKEYSHASGRLTGIKTVAPGHNNPIQNIEYHYDLAGNLSSRFDHVTGIKDSFEYDMLDRLKKVESSGKQNVEYAYDQVGNIISKSDVGVYEYSKSGPAHGVQSITDKTGQVTEYQYDANGNMTHSGQKTLLYNSSNQVVRIQDSRSVWSNFKYSPSGTLYFQDYRNGLQRIQTTYLGLYEMVREEMVKPFFPTNERLRHRYYVPTPSGLSTIIEDVTAFFPVRRSSHSNNAILVKGDDDRTSYQFQQERYLHHDLLGSITEVTDEHGNLYSRNRFDVWGKRLDEAPSTYHEYKIGFTGHEHLDHLGLIHMNGRVFDPNIARFVSADPFIQDSAAASAYNRYTYTFNNPLKFTDPSGFFLKELGRSIAKPFKKAGNWLSNKVGKPIEKFLKKNWKPIVIVVAAVVVTVGTAGLGAPAVVAGMAGGAVAGGLGAGLYGGSISDILTAAFTGAVIGGVSAGFFEAVGTMAQTHSWGYGTRVFAHGVVGGTMETVQGGDFMRGFASTGFTQAVSPGIDYIEGFEGAKAARVSAAAMVGGTAAEIGGGKFSNGAISGSFSRLFNDEAHPDEAPKDTISQDQSSESSLFKRHSKVLSRFREKLEYEEWLSMSSGRLEDSFFGPDTLLIGAYQVTTRLVTGAASAWMRFGTTDLTVGGIEYKALTLRLGSTNSYIRKKIPTKVMQNLNRHLRNTKAHTNFYKWKK